MDSKKSTNHHPLDSQILSLWPYIRPYVWPLIEAYEQRWFCHGIVLSRKPTPRVEQGMHFLNEILKYLNNPWLFLSIWGTTYMYERDYLRINFNRSRSIRNTVFRITYFQLSKNGSYLKILWINKYLEYLFPRYYLGQSGPFKVLNG